MSWFAYLVALILWNAFGLYEWALIAFVIGVAFHWNYWIPGIAAFFIAIGWKSPL